jgi:hypothetical protein
MKKPKIVPLVLSLEESQLVRAYRTTDTRGRLFVMSCAEGQARRWPNNPKPALAAGLHLRLVPGGRA